METTIFDDCVEGAPVVSCGEEERTIGERTRRQSAYKKRQPPLRKKFKPNPRPEHKKEEQVKFPDKILSISDLVAQDRKMCIETKQEAARQAQQPEDPECCVTLEQLMEAHNKLLGNVHIAHQLFDQQQLDMKGAITALKNGTATLQTIPAGLETCLLGEAGTFEIHNSLAPGGLAGAQRTFPACSNGNECVFKRDWNPKGAPGRSWMCEPEYMEFLRTGQLPPRRICILCHRFAVEDAACAVSSSDGAVKIEPEETLLQQYVNLMECPGGYRAECMQLHPADDGIYRGLFGPLVSYQKQHLAPYLDNQQINVETKQPALMLNQDKILWKPIQSNALPELGESSRDFQSGAAQPPQYKPLRNEENENPFLDLQQPGPEEATDYWTGLLIDACYCLKDKKQHNKLGGIVCQTTLPQLHSTIRERLFKRSLGPNRDMLRHLLFKAWPIRCWSRKFWTVLSRCFKTYCVKGEDAKEHRKHAKKEEERRAVEITLNRLLLCTLLGNYPHIPATAARPGPQMRRKLYGILDARGHREEYNSPESVRWRSDMLERCPRVYMHALQEFMCADIVDAPALVRHIRNTMPKFDAFFKIVQEATDWVRSRLHKIDFEAMSEMLETAREAILDTAYDHPHLPFLEFLREVRSFAKPDAKMWWCRNNKKDKQLAEFRAQGYAKPSSEISRRIRAAAAATLNSDSEAEDEEEEEEEGKLSKSERNPTSQAVMIEQAVREGLARASRREAVNVAGAEVLAITSMQITMAHSRVLEQWIGTFDPRSTSSDDVFWTVTRLLPLFGCTALAVSEAQHLWLEYALVKKAKDRWKSRMKLYSMRHPYAYALLQASRRFFARHRQFQVYPLPDNILVVQVQALEKTWGAAFAEAATIRICPCCRITNSIIRSAKTPHLNGIDGLRGVVTDVASGRIFCDRSAVFAHRQCGRDQELLKIPALGRWIGYKQRSIVLCCHCGHPMRPELGACIYDEKGLACVNCTAKLREQQAADWAKTHPELFTPEKFKCLLCDKVLATPKKRRPFFYVAKDTFVCNRHKDRELNKFFERFETVLKEEEPGLIEEMFTGDSAKRDRARKLALKVRAELKDQKEKSNRARNDYQLKLLKRNEARNQKR